MSKILAVVAALLATAGAQAADLTVQITAGSAPLRDAVVTVDSAVTAPVPRPGHYEVSQHDLTFDPYVLIVPVNSVVAFPNRDAERHHVYSFSPAKRFELKLYGHEEHRSVRFDKVGPVALGCNIHDQMSAFIKVVDTPFAAKTDAAGRVEFRGLPADRVTLRVWHPYLRAPGNELVRTVDTKAGTVAMAVTVRRPAPVRTDY